LEKVIPEYTTLISEGIEQMLDQVIEFIESLPRWVVWIGVIALLYIGFSVWG